MSDNGIDERIQLPFLDTRDFPTSGRCPWINELRIPLKNAYNCSREKQEYMDELVALLETVIATARPKPKRRKKQVD